MSSDDSDEKTTKRKERLEQNRLSARESRKRKKVMIEELQRTLLTLSRENKELNEQNEQLRRQLMDMASKVSADYCGTAPWVELVINKCVQYPNIIPLQSLLAITSDPLVSNHSSQNDRSLEEANNTSNAPPLFVPTLSLPLASSGMNELNIANMQPTDAALLANLLFRMSGAPLSSAQLFLTPTVQRAAATAAVAAATLSAAVSEPTSTDAEDDGAETEKNSVPVVHDVEYVE
jgi:hypothetical protein